MCFKLLQVTLVSVTVSVLSQVAFAQADDWEKRNYIIVDRWMSFVVGHEGDGVREVLGYFDTYTEAAKCSTKWMKANPSPGALASEREVKLRIYVGQGGSTRVERYQSPTGSVKKTVELAGDPTWKEYFDKLKAALDEIQSTIDQMTRGEGQITDEQLRELEKRIADYNRKREWYAKHWRAVFGKFPVVKMPDRKFITWGRKAWVDVKLLTEKEKAVKAVAEKADAKLAELARATKTSVVGRWETPKTWDDQNGTYGPGGGSYYWAEYDIRSDGTAIMTGWEEQKYTTSELRKYSGTRKTYTDRIKWKLEDDKIVFRKPTGGREWSVKRKIIEQSWRKR